ncbi:MAG: hypothetical protein WCP29_05475 [Acidobacteriota bacterium]
MFELLAIGAVLMGIVLVLGILALLVHLLFWVVLLPLRIVGVALKLAFGLLFLPVLVVAGGIGLVGLGIAAVVAVVLPLVPVVLAGAVVWVLAKALARPAEAPPHA